VHEVSIASTIWEQIRSVEAAHPGREAKRVEIDVGAFSGVESTLLADALVQLAQDQKRSDVEFSLNLIDLLAHCNECQNDFPVEDFRFRCLRCDSTSLKLIDGDSIRLMHVDMQLKESNG